MPTRPRGALGWSYCQIWRALLIGECKWGTEAVTRQTLRGLIEQTLPRTAVALPQQRAGWRVVPALYADLAEPGGEA